MKILYNAYDFLTTFLYTLDTQAERIGDPEKRDSFLIHQEHARVQRPGVLRDLMRPHAGRGEVEAQLAGVTTATDMANAWYTRDVRVKVPETVRFVLSGALMKGGVLDHLSDALQAVC